MPNIDCSPLSVLAPRGEHGGMGPFLRPIMPVDSASVGCVVEAGVRNVFGLSPYLSARAPEPASNFKHESGVARSLVRMRRPEIVYYEGLLSAAECKMMIAKAKKRLESSLVVDHSTGEGIVHPIRTSSGMSFKRQEDAQVAALENRMSQIFNWPVSKTEPFSMLRYRPGEFYNEHWDFFDYSTLGSGVHRDNGGNRVGTLILYLNDCPSGGETLFADLGLEVYPKVGSGVYFSYPNPHCSSMTRHAGRPPKKGEKWIATLWFKEGVFTSAFE